MKDGSSANPNSKRSSSGLFKSIGSLLGSSRTEQQITEAREKDEEENRDPLPDDMRDLEGRLNYHLSELDRLKNYIGLFNQILAEHDAKLNGVKERGAGMYSLEFDCLLPYQFLHAKLIFFSRYGCLCRQVGGACQRDKKRTQRLWKTHWISSH